MASLNQQDDEQQPQGQVTLSGGTGQNAGQGSPTSPVQQNQAPTGAAKFNDVSGYLDANQGGANQLASQVSSNLTNQYNQTKSGIDSSVNQTINAVNQGSVPENTDLIQKAASNPTGVVGNNSDLQNFQGQLNAKYTGPTSWDDYGNQQGKVQQAQQEGNLYKTAGGNNILAQQVELANNQGYSQGLNSLDAMLLQGNPDSYSQVAQASQPFTSLSSYLDTQNQNIGNQITGAQTATQKTAQDALNAFTGNNGTLTNLNNQIAHQANTALSTAQAQQQTIKDSLAQLYGGQAVDNTSTTITGYGGSQNPWYNTTNYTVGQMSPEALSALGMTPQQWSALQAAMQQAGTSVQGVGGHNFAAMSPTAQIDLSQFLNMQDPTQAITAATTATPEQYKQMSAIQQLLGDQMPQGAAINPALSQLAGTAPTAPAQFDYQAALDYANRVAQAEKDAANQETLALTSAADKAHADSQHHGGFLGQLESLPVVGTALNYLANPLTAVPKEIDIAKHPKDVTTI